MRRGADTNAMSCVLWAVAISCGARHSLARLAAAALRCILRRAHALRDRSGQPSACVFLGLSPKKSQMVAVNLGQRPRTRRQRLPAATEMSKAVLCTSPELAQVKALGLSSSSDSPFTQPACERRALVIDRTQRTCVK